MLTANCMLQTATRVLSQLKRIARAMWSNPPTHGARIAAEVVGDAGMFEEWKGEMRGMAGRIDKVSVADATVVTMQGCSTADQL